MCPLIYQFNVAGWVALSIKKLFLAYFRWNSFFQLSKSIPSNDRVIGSIKRKSLNSFTWTVHRFSDHFKDFHSFLKSGKYSKVLTNNAAISYIHKTDIKDTNIMWICNKETRTVPMALFMTYLVFFTYFVVGRMCRCISRTPSYTFHRCSLDDGAFRKTNKRLLMSYSH